MKNFELERLNPTEIEELTEIFPLQAELVYLLIENKLPREIQQKIDDSIIDTISIPNWLR